MAFTDLCIQIRPIISYMLDLALIEVKRDITPGAVSILVIMGIHFLFSMAGDGFNLKECYTLGIFFQSFFSNALHLKHVGY